MFSTLPPAPTTSPGWARRYCTRPSRGAVSSLSLMSASMRLTVAVAASTADSAPTVWALAASIAALAAVAWACAALSAASAPSTRARSSSSSCSDEAPSLARVSDRFTRRCAASSSEARWATVATLAVYWLSRRATSARAEVTACTARSRLATASCCCACNVSSCMRANGWPEVTKSPSCTRISATRPAYLLATSTSVASMRPLPLTRPSLAWARLHCCQPYAPAAATITINAVMVSFLFMDSVRQAASRVQGWVAEAADEVRVLASDSSWVPPPSAAYSETWAESRDSRLCTSCCSALSRSRSASSTSR